MERLSYHDAPQVPHVLAPYAEFLITTFRTEVMRISKTVGVDVSSLSEVFDRFHNIVEGMHRDGEFDHRDRVRIQERIDLLREEIFVSLGGKASDGGLEAA
jgi:hypothetical protein